MNNILNYVKIIGTGSYVPENVITNEYLENKIDTNSKWIYENLGIEERRICDKNQTTSDIAYLAAKNALDNAQIKSSEIDLIILATATPDRKAPSTAAIVQHKLNAFNAAAFDVAAVCSGFLYAISIANQYIATGTYKNVLIIGVDTFSKITDWTKRDAVFFGDGAGAAILSNSISDGFLSTRIYTDTSNNMFGFTIPGGGSEIPLNENNLQQQYFQMNGRSVYDTAIVALPKAINQVLQDANLSIEDIDYMIPHQPSIRILQKTAELVGLPWEKVMTNMNKYANTSGGTVPILLDEINRSGILKPGKNILFAAVGSGWTYGASILKWQ